MLVVGQTRDLTLWMQKWLTKSKFLLLLKDNEQSDELYSLIVTHLDGHTYVSINE